MKAMLGKKVKMTQVFLPDGTAAPVTLIAVNPCEVTAVRTEAKEGYNAVQLGCGEQKKTRKGKKSFTHLKEFRMTPGETKTGDTVAVTEFKVGDAVIVSGISKGKGFAGVMKRHGFHGSPKTHGHKHDHRAAGSVGSRFPQHTPKGRRMAGRMGNDQVTVRSKVVVVDAEHNILAVKGAVPGPARALVVITAKA